MLNLDNAERGQIAPDSNEVKILSPEDKRRVGASLHPLEGSELVTSLSQQFLVSSWLTLISECQYSISISQSHNDSEKKTVPSERTRTSHTEVVIFC
jgi:hypothetical protein